MDEVGDGHDVLGVMRGQAAHDLVELGCGGPEAESGFLALVLYFGQAGLRGGVK